MESKAPALDAKQRGGAHVGGIECARHAAQRGCGRGRGGGNTGGAAGGHVLCHSGAPQANWGGQERGAPVNPIMPKAPPRVSGGW